MREGPIAFTKEMCAAIFAGHKKQTRRIFKGEAYGDFECICTVEKGLSKNLLNRWGAMFCSDFGAGFKMRSFDPSPYGGPGDRLWIKTGYYKDAPKTPSGRRYIPPMFCKRDRSPGTLEVVGLRLERLQSITEADAQEEGLSHEPCGWFVPGNAKTGAPTAVECFSQLWDSINGEKYPWESNSLVWVVEFKLLGP